MFIEPQEILDFSASLGWELGGIFLFFSSLIEYVFPPFPGDTVTIVGAILSVQANWPITVVLFATVLGSGVGAALNWKLGDWLKNEGTSFLHRWIRSPKIEKKLQNIEGKFQKYGPIYIALNRFIPAFRSLFFIAAGYSGLSLRLTVFWALISALLFNTILYILGFAIGFNLEKIMALFQQFAMGILVAGLISLVVYLAIKYRKKPNSPKI